jgi:hypothetical protein
MKTNIQRAIVAAAAAGAIALPLGANAAIPGETQVRGTITAINGKYDLHVRDRNGDVDDVLMHQGTIINPTGLTLEPGMHVTVVGNTAGQTLDASEIDTPYQISYVQPIDPYFDGPGWGFGWGGWGWGYRRW